jgi:hypothetical protein
MNVDSQPQHDRWVDCKGIHASYSPPRTIRPVCQTPELEGSWRKDSVLQTAFVRRYHQSRQNEPHDLEGIGSSDRAGN